MLEQNYYTWRDQMAALQEQRRSAGDLAPKAADQGKEDVMAITRLLRDLLRQAGKEALRATLFALHGLKICGGEAWA